MYCGSDYTVIGIRLAKVERGKINKTLEMIKKIQPQYRIAALRGVGIYYGYLKNNEFLDDFLNIAERCDDLTKKQLYRGLSISLIAYSTFFDNRSITLNYSNGKNFNIQDILAKVDPSSHCFFREKLGDLISPSIKFRGKKGLNKSKKILRRFANFSLIPSFYNYRLTYNNDDILYWHKRIRKLPNLFKSYFYHALGRAVVARFIAEKETLMSESIYIPDKYKGDFFSGLASASSLYFSKNPENSIEYISTISEKYRKPFIFSLGKALFWKYPYNFKKISKFAGKLSIKEKKAFYEGIGSGAGYMLYWNPLKLKEIKMKIPEDYRRDFENAANIRIQNDEYLAKQEKSTYFRDFEIEHKLLHL
ncbi:MAG: hypothetical protein D6734_10820 [Candidatus Schekmanbacteria bacterium]|nr:MAG: hypothetical protein D6734_10820 [Candidatus Schekmanbacteria bacterium]